MFFRREKAKVLTFEDHLRNVEQAGFTVQREGQGARAIRGFCAAQFEMGAEDKPRIARSGILFGTEIAVLVFRGYQMTLETGSGKKAAAQAAQLKTLHAFEEDLREALGLTSLYNKSLGTVSTRHDYDRVENRDEAPAPKPWKTGRPVAG
ncbi:MAG: hypothetical protein U5J83_13555 [Bryobacterales bacterium]|nr:hypothetical protein [Bryobacterales bacterium]